MPSWCSSTRCGRISARSIWNRRSPSSVGVNGDMAASAADAPVGAAPSGIAACCCGSLSAVVLGPLLLAAIWFGFPWIDLVAALAAPLHGLGMDPADARPAVAARPGRSPTPWPPSWRCSGCAISRRWAARRSSGSWLCIWATDIGAYVVGRAAGGAKLAPRISPSKTWSGLVGGMAWAAVASAAVGYAFGLGDDDSRWPRSAPAWRWSARSATCSNRPPSAAPA